MLNPRTPEKQPRREKQEEAAVDESITLSSLARDALAQFDNDVEAAREYLFEQLSTDTRLLRALIAQAVRVTAGASVNAIIIQQRSKAFAGVEGAARGRSAAQTLSRVVASSLFDVTLSNGMRLKDATQYEIVETAERWEKQAATMSHRSRWLRAVANAMPPGKRCSEVFTEKKLQALYEKAA